MMKDVSLTDSQAETIYALGHDAYEHGQYTKAATIFNGLAVTKKDNAKYWAALGSAQQMLKKYDKALQAFLFAAALNPKDPDAYLRAAECLWHQGDKAKALFTLESAGRIAAQDKGRHEALLHQLEVYKHAWSIERSK